MNGHLLLEAIDRAFNLQLSDARKRGIEDAHLAYFMQLAGEVVPVAGADRAARALERLGVRMAVVTSADRSEAERFFAPLNLTPSTVIVTREENGRSKPARPQLDQAFKELRVQPHEAAYVGDSVWDMLASRNAGSFGVGVLTGGYSREELTASGAYRVYRDVAELLAHVEELGIDAA